MECGSGARGRRPLPVSRRPARAASSPVGRPDELASSLAALSPAALSAGAACAAAPLPPTRRPGMRCRSSPTGRRAPLPPAGPRAPPLEMDGNTLYNELEVVEGMKLDRGYISPYFITNQKNQKCELDDPLILIHEVSNLHAVAKVLELALKKQRPLLIVAEDLESEALGTLIIKVVAIKVCAVKGSKLLGLGRSLAQEQRFWD